MDSSLIFFCHCLFLASSSFGALGGLCLMIVVIPGYFSLIYFGYLVCLSFQAMLIGKQVMTDSKYVTKQ